MKLREFEEEQACHIQDGERRKSGGIHLWRQILASVSSMTAMVGVGMTFSFIGTWNLTDHGIINKDQETLLGMLILFSMMVGTGFSWLFSEILGFQICMFFLSLIWVVGWFVLAFSSNYLGLLIGCILAGVPAGFSNNITTRYLIEMPEPKLRGTFAVFSSACNFLGLLLGHLSNIIFESQPWGMLFCASSPLLTMVFVYWSPNSPYWLLKNNRLDKAKHHFFKLRGKTLETETEFDEISSRQLNNEPKTKCSSVKKLTRGFMKPFFISVLIFSCSSGSGSDVIIMYAQRILKQLSSNWNTNFVIILIDVILIISCTLSSYVVKLVTRRSMFLYSSIGVISALLIIIASQVYNLPDVFLTIILCAYMAINSFGLNPMAWLVSAEIFPERNRHMGIGAVTIYYFLLTIALLKFVPTPEDDTINEMNSMVPYFWFFVGVMLVCSSLLFFIMPETKDVTLEKIEDQMARKKIISIKWRRKKSTIT